MPEKQTQVIKEMLYRLPEKVKTISQCILVTKTLTTVNHTVK